MIPPRRIHGNHANVSRYAMLPHEELVARAIEMKQEIKYRKARVAREIRELDRAAKMFHNLGAVRLAKACGADPVVTTAIAEINDTWIADRAANAIADRRWREAAYESRAGHRAADGASAGGAAG